ncbi:MAG TPA: hypothetical protein VFE42_20950 [Chloroflexota bacterium]|nr:hypothetical protein [Chloroflexota bacterium]
MEAAVSPDRGDERARPVAKLPSRVIAALDHFTPAERAAVEQAALSFARGEATASRLPDPEPLYLVRATPDLLVLVRRDASQPVVIEDIVTQEAWDHLAHAG